MVPPRAVRLMPETSSLARKKLVREDGMPPVPIAPASYVELGVTTPFSFMRTASSTAISQNGFIAILMLARSTPEPSAFTRGRTFGSITRLTGTSTFIGGVSGWTVRIMLAAPPNGAPANRGYLLGSTRAGIKFPGGLPGQKASIWRVP